MKRTAFVLAALAIAAFTSPAPAKQKEEPPVVVTDAQWRQLWDYADPGLQHHLERHLRRSGLWARLIAQQKLAVGLVDLRDMSRPRYAAVNGNVMMYAASLPKIAILLAAFDAMDKGELRRTPEVSRDLRNMIRVSSNGAATRTIDRLGGLKRVNAVLMDPRYRFYDTQKGGGLWVGKRYAKTGGRIPDPISGTSHGATVSQVCRFYYELATGSLINRKASAEMLRILSNPGLHHKFVKTLERTVSPAVIYRKSGTWKQWHSDSVLVYGSSWRRYILVAMVESPEGEKIMQDLVGAVEEALLEGAIRARATPG